MKFIWNKDTSLLLGRKQWGKTSTIKMLIKGISKENIIVLDSNYEYEDFPNRWIPKEYTPRELDKFIQYCRRYVNKLIIIDDIDLFFSSAQPTDEFKKFLINASHQDLGLICTSKRPLFIPKMLLTETIHLFIGNFLIKNDVDYLSSFISDKKILEKLKRFEFLYRNTDTGEEKIFKTKS